MTTPEADELVGPTTELLQSLIRNECVNDGTPGSGYETRNADLLQTYLEGAGLDVARFEKQEGRASIVARIEGSDPDAPSLCLMGHTDVVPVNPEGWSREPFSGEVLDGEVWGRGAIDMLNITASMAVAFRRLANEGFQPKGDLIYFGVADEEAGGEWGAEFMVNEHWDAVGADYVVTELGGWSQVDGNGDRHIVINVGEKGIAWTRLRVKGTPAHGSMPFGADNALITAAEIVRRLAEFRPPARLDDIWRGQVASLDVPDDLRAALLDPATVWDTIATLPPAAARIAHACTHTTISPNVAHGGQKTNTIPDSVDLDIDIRLIPGDTIDTARGYLREAIGDLWDRVEITQLQHAEATRSATSNALWDTIATKAQATYPGATLQPGLIVGGTDARYFREKGSIAYGAGLYSPDVTFESFGQRFHGNDERIDTESLGLSAQFWHGLATDLVG
ncbi:MAG: M20/M25/M40 family metallo-hydrolase [Actinomycetota bacterium]|nr:M20/M25/M40 family metallo-hydrolase [Actinomycetota bacterium]